MMFGRIFTAHVHKWLFMSFRSCGLECDSDAQLKSYMAVCCITDISGYRRKC